MKTRARIYCVSSVLCRSCCPWPRRKSRNRAATQPPATSSQRTMIRTLIGRTGRWTRLRHRKKEQEQVVVVGKGELRKCPSHRPLTDRPVRQTLIRTTTTMRRRRPGTTPHRMQVTLEQQMHPKHLHRNNTSRPRAVRRLVLHHQNGAGAARTFRRV